MTDWAKTEEERIDLAKISLGLIVTALEGEARLSVQKELLGRGSWESISGTQMQGLSPSWEYGKFSF